MLLQRSSFCERFQRALCGLVLLAGLLLSSALWSSSGIAQAQNGDDPTTATISVTGTVILGLTIEGVLDLVFDDIVAGDPKTINLDGTATGASVTGEEQAGKFRIDTRGNFTLEFVDLPNEMIGPDGASMPVSFFSGWSEDDDGANATNPVETGAPTPVLVPESEVFVFLGATVEPPPTQTLGQYETTVTLRATFGVD
ncbi:hypothetical protein CYPRO_1123 [Cyclonatronum proteinivorum]|uniref:DUF4402 domain-containing protein n=2 Tax=Cyclonatronum proteinivorum TaxID=1457365 RepID=A0A345UIT6_9BACT|nr:hypothetical protein CYPRO_1123 [Cyclonatronum proteinivorum]